MTCPTHGSREKTAAAGVGPNSEGLFESCFPGEFTQRAERDIELDKFSYLDIPGFHYVFRGALTSRGQSVAVGYLKCSCEKHRELLKEVMELNRQVHCEFVAQMYFGATCPVGSGALHFVMELMDLGNLADLLSAAWESPQRSDGELGVPAGMLACIAQQLLEALAHTHAQLQMPAQLELRSALLNKQGCVKLTCPMGGSVERQTLAFADRTLDRTCVKSYMSPERCLGTIYSDGEDVWRLGMMLHELASGSYAFADAEGIRLPRLFELITEGPEPRLNTEHLPPALCDFVARCLTRSNDAPAWGQEKLPYSAAVVTEHGGSAPVVVRNLAGEHIFGPAALEGEVCAGQLAKLLWETTCVRSKSLTLVSEGRGLSADELLPLDASLELTLVMVNSARADLEELRRHELLDVAASRAELATWLGRMLGT